MITTTLRKLREADACVPRYTHLRRALGKNFVLDKVLPLSKILETNGRDDVLWALNNAIDGGDKILRLWAADCAEHVLHIFETKYPEDDRPRKAIEAVRQFARGAIGAAEAARAARAARAAGAAVDAVNARAAWNARNAVDAWAAEETWQTQRLLWYLEDKPTSIAHT